MTKEITTQVIGKPVHFKENEKSQINLTIQSIETFSNESAENNNMIIRKEEKTTEVIKIKPRKPQPESKVKEIIDTHIFSDDERVVI